MNTRLHPRSSARKTLFYFILVLFSALLLLLVAEVAARIIGYLPWRPTPRNTVVQPGESFFVKDDRLGYAMKPGEFNLILNDSISFQTKHNSAGYRTSGNKAESSTYPQIWMLGGSFTYGWGVNTSEAYPAKIQQAFPEYEISNFGVGGYGTLHALYQLKDRLATGKRPTAVILAYASFHDQRNTCSRYWMKAIAPQALLQGLAFPCARIDLNDQLVYTMEPVTYSPWFGMKISAFIHALEGMKCKADERRRNSPEVSRRLIMEINEICAKRSIPFILAGIEPDEATVLMLERCNSDGVVTIDISVDRSQLGMSLEPWDPHPSAAAHQVYAEKLIPTLRSILKGKAN